VTRTVSISLDQFYRPQPGGIATYVRGLVGGLVALHEDSLQLVGVAPRGLPTEDVSDLALERVIAPASIKVLTRVWARWPLGVPSCAAGVGAPRGGGGQRRGARHVAGGPVCGWKGRCRSLCGVARSFVARRAQHEYLSWGALPRASTPDAQTT
jgi:hypothetical protein